MDPPTDLMKGDVMPQIPELLAYQLQKLDANRTQAVMMPLGALNSVVSISAAEEPGTYRCILCTNGEQVATDIFTTEEVTAKILPLLMKNERLIQLQAILLQRQTEKFLEELVSGE